MKKILLACHVFLVQLASNDKSFQIIYSCCLPASPTRPEICSSTPNIPTQSIHSACQVPASELPFMSSFYLCSKNHSIVGQMDTYLAFHRDSDTRNHPSQRHAHSSHKEERIFGEKAPHLAFNPTFPSNPNLSDESSRPNYLNNSPTSPYHLGRDGPTDEALNKIKNANTGTITPELFEKIYLNPQKEVKGELRNTFGNPTPLALLGFLLSLSPLSCELMGWRGAGGDGIATIGAYYFIGGFLMSLGGILEFFLGNTFSFVVFCSFGGFWFTLGATLTPSFNAYGAYASDPNNIATGLVSPQFHASFGRYFSS